MIDAVAVLLLITGIVNLIAAASVFVRASKGISRWLFGVLAGYTVVWCWGVGLFLASSTIEHAQWYANVYYAAAMAIGSGLIVFALNQRGSFTRRWLLIAYLPTVLFGSIVTADPYWLLRVVRVGGPLGERVTIDYAHYSIYGVVFLITFLTGWWLLRTLRPQRRKDRRRLEIVYLGVLASGSMGMLFNLILPWFGSYDFIAVGPLFTVIFTMSITYASVRYSMFDLRQTFAMSLAYVLASSTAALCYIGAVWTVGNVIAESIASPSVTAVIYVTMALLVALTITPLKAFFDRVTAKLFLREQHTPEVALDQFGDAILDDIDIASITSKALESINEVIHPVFSAVVLLDRNDPTRVEVSYQLPAKTGRYFDDIAEELGRVTRTTQVAITDVSFGAQVMTSRLLVAKDIAVAVRMQIKDQVVGYVVAGEKRSGDSYGMSERSMLAAMANEVALAVVNSQRFDEIQLFNTRLKQEVARATRELRTSNKKLLEMDATKDEFVSMASHQLRTPLTSVKGYISMVLEGDVGTISPQQRQLLEEAYTSSERMVHLIGDFLNVSRLQTGKFMIDPRETDLANIVRQEVDGIQQIASTHDITIIYKQPLRFPLLYLDENKIRQVIMNFIDNAIYYSPEGSNITVSLELEDGDAVLLVKDKGMGVPLEVQHKLFTKFFRAENARKQRPDGTGIGLYLAKQVIDGHKGKLVFVSTINRGSTFGFRLPVKKLSSPLLDEETKNTP